MTDAEPTPHEEPAQFDQLGLSEPVLKAIDEIVYATGYKISVCYRQTGGQLRCAIDDFK